jgi:protein-tyrosine phosphatase
VRLTSALLALSLAVASPGCSPAPRLAPQSRAQDERHWAEPLERPGLPNLHRVTPLLYRGAQPTRAGFFELGRMGVKSVVSLRTFHADSIPIDANLHYERIAFKAWHPEDEDVVRFLRLITDPARQPVYVHCQFGADRTGMMVAIERIALEGWTKDEAIAEMTDGDYGFHPEWQNLINYVRELDVDRIAHRAGVKR